MNIRKLLTGFAAIILAATLTTAAFAQGRATLRGQISDEFGASIVGASVVLTDASGTPKTATTNGEGTYTFTGLTPGKYTIQAIASGFAISEAAAVEVAVARRDPFNITLKIAAIETQVKVDANTPLSTDTSNNANQQVLTGKDLEALPDDPDELAAALQALAGPSVGPSGGQIFIDGFSGGNLPPKESIREIRINQNPFSAENDQPSARIDILTRPGTDKFRGGANFNFNDESLNSRNPFAISSSKRSAFQIRQFGGNLSGPLVKGKASFYVDFNRGETDDSELVRATVLDPALNITQLGFGFLVPRRNMHFGPRIDYAINSRNTLIARYGFFTSKTKNQGVGNFSLPERGYDNKSTNHNIQLTETAVLNATTLNETRFQWSRGRSESLGNNTIPVLNVSGAFISGGSQIGHVINENTRWELNNFTQMQRGMHTFKFGGRIRVVSIDDINPNNYGGQWVFAGGVGPALDASNNPIPGTNVQLTSIERYRRTLLFSQLGRSPQEIRSLGGGAAQFSISSGNPQAEISQTDIGVYFQDDWRVRPNFTFNYGIRYERQTNADSQFNFAPRIGFAWSPGAGDSTRPPKMVIRGGGGIFYNRFGEGLTLTARRLNGTSQLQFVVPEPTFKDNGVPRPPNVPEQTSNPGFAVLNSFPTIPLVSGVPATVQTTYRIAPNIQEPTMYLAGVQVERQLPKNITAFIGVYTIRTVHVIRPRDINAPLPGTITTANPLGTRPIAGVGDIYQYETSGKQRQTQMAIGFNSRLNPRLSLSGNYSLSKTTNDTDGGFPVNSYDMSGEYGRAGFDVRHRFTLIGTVNSPWWKLAFNPFIVVNSGPPFNITTGRDTNLDRQYNERPSFAAANADCNNVNTRCTQFGNFNMVPSPGEQIIPRNYGRSPGSLSVNMRISRTFTFGGESARASAPASPQGDQKTASAGEAGKPVASGGARGGGPSIVGGGMAGGQRGGGPGGGGPGMMMTTGGPGGGGAGKYSLNVSVNFQNLLNRVNLSRPEGNLSSSNFGQSLGLGGGFGGFGGGGGGSSGAGNRRISLNVRFNF